MKFLEILRIIEFAERFIENDGADKSSLAKRLGFSTRYIADIKAGKSKNPGSDFVLALINKMGFNPVWIETGEGAPFINQDSAGGHQNAHPMPTGAPIAMREKEETALIQSKYKIPLLRQKVSCGPGVNWESEDNIEEYIAIDTFIPNLGLGRIFAMKVNGSSMIGAGIKDGDYLLFESEESPAPVDGIYVFSLDGDIFCKRLEFDRFTKKLYIFSMRTSEIEKAELIASFDTTETSFADRFFLFGRVVKLVRTIYYDR